MASHLQVFLLSYQIKLFDYSNPLVKPSGIGYLLIFLVVMYYLFLLLTIILFGLTESVLTIFAFVLCKVYFAIYFRIYLDGFWENDVSGKFIKFFT